MFATRKYESLQDRVEGALNEQGRQVVLFGLTGVGKTSLVGHLCRHRKIAYVRVECGPTFEDMMREALAKVVKHEEIEWVESQSAEAGVGATLYGLIRGEVKAKAGSETKYANFPVSLATAAAEAFRLKKVRVLFLDNFENLRDKQHSASTSRALAELMKSFADRAAEAGKDTPKVVVAGIPDASATLVQLDEATARRTAQVEVPRMPEDELDQILARGEQKLGITFEGLLRDRIIQSSDGFPYYAHMFALHCSRRAIHAERSEVMIDDFDASLASILADCDLELRTAYEAAVETTGKVQMRKSVMEAIAILNDLEVPFKAIRESFLGLHPEYQSIHKLNFLSTAITPLKGDYGILTDSGKPKSPNNKYRFVNPLMRGYVRLRMLNEKQGELVI
jgi:conflict system STAND superfamily ATPase